MPETRTIAGVDLVECQPRRLWLREAACVADWRAARKRPDPGAANYPCIGCAVGCDRAGAVPAVAISDRTRSKRKWCVRCSRQAQRLIRGRICVSCYNREQEAAKGRDRRGRVPKNSPRVYLADLLLGAGSRIDSLRLARVASTLEAALVVYREQDDAAFLCRRASPVRGQQRLFG